MTRDEYLIHETAHYIDVGLDLIAARKLAADNWVTFGGKTHGMRAAEARERLKARHRQQRLDVLDREFQWDLRAPENQRWHE